MKPKRQKKIAVAFKLYAPEAVDVQVAGDFTGWDASPLPLERNGGGLWQTQVMLSPARYEYRFLVDGQWQNDPACPDCAPNAFGTANNFIELK